MDGGELEYGTAEPRGAVAVIAASLRLISIVSRCKIRRTVWEEEVGELEDVRGGAEGGCSKSGI